MNLPKCLQKFAEMIDEISDERNSGDGYWVYLKAGYRNELDETHCVHEDTPSECAKIMKFVEPCGRDCCKPTP